MSLQEIPMLRVLLPFLAGLLFAFYFDVALSPFITIPSVLGLLFLSRVIAAKRHFSYHWASGTALTIALFVSAVWVTNFHTDRLQATYFGHHLHDSTTHLLLKLEAPPEEKPRSYQLQTKVYGLFDIRKDRIYPVTGKALVYIPKDSTTARLQYGDLLLTKNTLHPTHPPQNPAQFNYKSYLATQQIHYQGYLTKADWIHTGHNEGYLLFATAYTLRKQFLGILQKHITNESELAVTSSIILGYRSLLTNDIREAYATSGAMHILAVSGLHVGLIYLVLQSMLKLLPRYRYALLIQVLLLLSAIWGFALLTGLRPSVLRAGTMFSFLVIGQTLRRHANIYNTLAASALFLLCFNPYYIKEVGFQLSYLAVTGIVFIQPRLYDQVVISNYLLDKLWALTAVAIAAQVATFPLGLLYFQHFPAYFWLANIFVIPGAMLVLYLGILLLAADLTGLAAQYVGILLDYIAWSLNTIVFSIEELPFSRIYGISISPAETLLIYILIIALLAFWVLPRLAYLSAALTIGLLLAGYNFYENTVLLRQQQLAVYHVPWERAYNFSSGKDNVLIGDHGLLNNESKLRFYIKNHWWARDMEMHTLYALDSLSSDSVHAITPWLYRHGPWLQYGAVSCFLLDRHIRWPPHSPAHPLDVDFVFVAHSPSLNIKEMLTYLNPETIVFDSSNKPWFVEKWMAWCKKRGVLAYHVGKSGAFVFEREQ